MSPERGRLTRRQKVLLISVAVFFTIWVISPWLYMSGVRVEDVRLFSRSDPSTSPPKNLTSPEWIRIRFTTGEDLISYRQRWNLPFIQAGILPCDGSVAGRNDKIATQRSEIFVDWQRVRALGAVTDNGKKRFVYEAAFDNTLSSIGDDHRGRDITATTVPGGLCFRLHGATIASGSVRSATIPLVISGR